MKESLKKLLVNPQTYLGIAALQAVAAILGSLYFSNIALYAPCMLCWWQRIFMYPLAFILPVAFFTKDRGFLKYATPLVVIGTAISLYHNEMYYLSMYHRLQGTIDITTCSLTGPSCTAIYIEWFGFITIPLLALIGFLVIAASLITYAVLTKKQAA